MPTYADRGVDPSQGAARLQPFAVPGRSLGRSCSGLLYATSLRNSGGDEPLQHWLRPTIATAIVTVTVPGKGPDARNSSAMDTSPNNFGGTFYTRPSYRVWIRPRIRTHSCHSPYRLDRPYKYRSDGRIRPSHTLCRGNPGRSLPPSDLEVEGRGHSESIRKDSPYKYNDR
jgi:hypothetical protein